jgi:uncharacterized protein (DUF433 family)
VASSVNQRRKTSQEKIPQDLPLYSAQEAAHWLHLPPSTVRDWAFGRRHRGVAPVLALADPKSRLLSFTNLLELHVLDAIRRTHSVNWKAVGKAVGYLSREFGSKRPLLDKKMRGEGKELFVEQYGELANASANERGKMKKLLGAFLDRIEWDEAGVPIRLYPFVQEPNPRAPLLIAIDPRIQFGRPCIAGTGIPTAIIAERHEAGDSVQELAEDYDRLQREIQAALDYERSPGPA